MAPATILVVEDNEDIQQFVSMVLEMEGYRIRTAKDGQVALADLRAYPSPCCILLDMLMPVMDGRAFRLAQLQDPQLAAIPVIVMSAHAHVVESLDDLDVAAYLRKPFMPDQLLAVVRQMCP